MHVALRSRVRAMHKRTTATANKEERCVIVNEQNQVIGSQPRSITVSQRLLGRGSYCLVVNDKIELLVSKRSMTKDLYPGMLDTVISGVCQDRRVQGHSKIEEYRDTAERELVEELGLNEDQRRALSNDETLTLLGIFPYKDNYCHVFGCAFIYHHSGQMSLQEEEVDAARWMPLSEVVELLEAGKDSLSAGNSTSFTPVGRHILCLYMDRLTG